MPCYLWMQILFQNNIGKERFGIKLVISVEFCSHFYIFVNTKKSRNGMIMKLKSNPSKKKFDSVGFMNILCFKAF